MSGRLLVYGTALALGGLLIAFAWYGYPAPGSDAPSFVVSAINVASGRGLVNPLYPQIAVADPTGLARHVYYPPLFPLVLSWLMVSPTPQQAFVAIAALRLTSLLLAAHLLLRVSAGSSEPRPALTFLIAISLCGLCTNWLPTAGRPEALATLLVLGLALAVVALPMEGAVPLAGTALGLLAATQPFGALEAFLLLGVWLASRFAPGRTLALLAAVGALAALVVIVVLILSPHGLLETVRGMLRAYPATPWNAPPGSDWWRPWLLHRRSTFYGPLLLASVACAIAILRRRPRVGSPALLVLFAALLAACLFHGSLTHGSRRHYNALLFSPLIYASLVAWYAAPGQGAVRRMQIARTAIVVAVVASAAGFLGYLACFPWFLRHARTLPDARAEWQRLALPPGSPLFATGPAWTLMDDHGALQLGSRPLVAGLAGSRPTLVIGQRLDDAGAPPTLPGFQLEQDLFSRAMTAESKRARFVEEDYSFAVYVPR
jgi:hypothetical protein